MKANCLIYGIFFLLICNFSGFASEKIVTRIQFNTEAHVYYKKLNIAQDKITKDCDYPQEIGRNLTIQEMQDVKNLCNLTADVYTAMSRKNKVKNLNLNYAKKIIDNSEHFTSFDPELANIPIAKGKTSIRGLNNWIKTWEQGFKHIEMLNKLAIINLDIKINGNMAITTFTDKVSFKIKGKKMQNGSRNNTLIWSYKNQGWYIIHEHASSGN